MISLAHELFRNLKASVLIINKLKKSQKCKGGENNTRGGGGRMTPPPPHLKYSPALCYV